MQDWLLTEQDIPPLAATPDPMSAPAGAGPLGTGPGGFEQGGYAGTDPNTPDPNIANQGVPQQEPAQDVSKDPETPDMPEESEDIDFETWKKQFFKETVVGNPNKLIELIKQIRERNLESYERKFVEDNIRIQRFRQNSNVKQASDKIRKLIREQLDENNPSISLTKHMHEVLSTMPELSNMLIKMLGLLGAKGDAHRKYIAGIIGGIQVGSGASTEDIIFNEKDFALAISTRLNSVFGDISLGKWELKEDDPERYLKEPELARLDSGSPEEKDALRKRLIIESIADRYQKRAFIVNVVRDDGTVTITGLDLANCLRTAFRDGKLIVKMTKSDNSEAMIEDNGAIIALMDIKINYRKPTGKLDEEGNREYREIPFIERREGLLFLVASDQLLNEAASTLQGLAFKTIPYNGNPSDLKALTRSVPDVTELLLVRNP